MDSCTLLQPLNERGSTMTATNNDDQLDEIYSTMLNEHLALLCHVFIAVAVMVMVCGRHGIGPNERQKLLNKVQSEFYQ